MAGSGSSVQWALILLSDGCHYDEKGRSNENHGVKFGHKVGGQELPQDVAPIGA